MQESTPGTPGALEALMREGVITRLETEDELDELSTTEMLNARSRRLAFRFVDGVGSIWWHSVDAGKDPTGRPGNVFTHAIAVAGRPDRIRPIDLWRSPDWLMPYGQTEVAAAGLMPFDLMAVDQRSSAVERAFSRQSETEALLGAIAHCHDRGWSLVLASREQEEFFAWCSVVSHLTAANVAVGALSFSSFDRVARLHQAHDIFRLIGIPTTDLPLARELAGEAGAQRMLVLDLDDLPSDPVGGEWTSAGQRWPSAGLWQEAFFELTDADHYNVATALEVLDLMDDLCADGDEVRDVGAPLAAALLERCADQTARDTLLDQWKQSVGPAWRSAVALLRPDPPPPQATVVSAQPLVVGSRQPADYVFSVVRLPETAKATRDHRRLAAALLAAEGALSEKDTMQVERWIERFDGGHDRRSSTDPDRTLEGL